MALTCKTSNYLIFMMIIGLICLHPGPSSGEEWGKIMSSPAKTNIRAKRSIDAGITGQLKAGDRVSADFLQDGWYAVFAPDEQERLESKARGYVYASRLLPVPSTAAGKHKDRGSGKVSEKTAVAPASREEQPLMLKNITFKFEPAGHEKVFIDFNRDVVPEISSIEGNDPRIVIDIKNVLSVRQGLARIKVQGKLIRQIRSALDRTSHRLRIVLDLAPLRNFEVEPAYYKAEKMYVLDISETVADSGPRSQRSGAGK
jgi:hypothetical protein